MCSFLAHAHSEFDLEIACGVTVVVCRSGSVARLAPALTDLSLTVLNF